MVTQVAINADRNGGVLVSFLLLFRYFTLWTNVACGIVLALVALRGRMSAALLFALATAIAIVAIVYHVLLAGQHHPTGWDWWTNLMFHTLLPLATVLWWLAFGREASGGWRSLWVVIPWPILYSVFAILYGLATGFYPYFFLNLPELGWGLLIAWLVGLAAVFVALGALLRALRLLVGIRRPYLSAQRS